MLVVKNLKHALHAPKQELSVPHMVPIPYFESPMRIAQIEKALARMTGLQYCEPDAAGPEILRGIHAKEYISYIEKVGRMAIDDEDYRTPFVIPPRTRTFNTSHMIDHLALFAMDTTTPIGRHTFTSALHSAAVAATGARKILNGEKKVYCLCRPPGHHAEPSRYGGYCYFNNAAVAAEQLLLKTAKVSILDIDYHHGNGTQEIFYRRNDLQYVSVHADPRIDYPYYTGFKNERGQGRGLGFNLNLPVPKDTGDNEYLTFIEQGLTAIGKFKAEMLIVSLGVDTYTVDPVGALKLSQEVFGDIGCLIKQINLPVLVLQEGGYNVRDIGTLVSNFLKGLGV